MVLVPRLTSNIYYGLHFVQAIISVTSVAFPLALYWSSSVVAVVAFDDLTLHHVGSWDLYRQVSGVN